MSLNIDLNKNDELNSKVKSQLNEKKIRKIRKTLLFLAEKDIKSCKSYNIKVIKKDESDNRIVMPTIIPQKIFHEDFEKLKLNLLSIENEVNSDQSELANSSDFENEDDE